MSKLNMTTLFRKKYDYYMEEIPIQSSTNNDVVRNRVFEYAILYYGSILDPKETWQTLRVPIAAIKAILPTSGNWKIEIVWNENEEYNIDFFNKVEFE